jgi:serine/threonine protein kinase
LSQGALFPTLSGEVDRASAAAGSGQNLDDAITPAVRKVRRAGPYRLLKLLGRGGMAEVYRAERPPGVAGPGPANCVVKTIRGELAQSPEFARMFAGEIQVMRLLQHPNIVRTYDHGMAAGTLYLTMEFLDGLNLSRLVRSLAQMGERLPVPLAAYIAAEIAEALAYAHAVRDEHGRCLGLVHRDVSPGNIMLLRNGQVKLVDFGIAKMSATVSARARRAAGRAAGPELVKGKPNYMAPEQLLDQPLDGRADLFSLGVVLWELLTWRPLFSRPTPRELAAVVLAGDIERPSVLCPEVSPALETIVLRALDRDPRRRQRGADELARELRRFALPAEQARPLLGKVVDGLARRAAAPPAPARPPSPPPAQSPWPATTALPAASLPAAISAVGGRGVRSQVRALAWTILVAAAAFLGGVKWAGRNPTATSVVSAERTVPSRLRQNARIHPLPSKKIVSNASETSSR